MAQNGSFKISVGLVDQASSGLAKINKQIAAAKKPMDDLNRQIDRFGKLTGISKLHDGVHKLISPLEKVGKLFLGMFGMGSIAGIIATTRQFANLSNEIMRTSAALGISTSKMQELQNAGSLLGTGSGSMGSMLQTIQDNQLKMKFGGDGDLQTIYQKLGLSQKNSATEIRDKVLDYVNTHLKKGDVDPAVLRQLSMKMLGTTDYMGMDSKQVHSAENRAKFLGRYNEENIKNANKLRESYQGVLTAINGVTQTIIGRLAPKLSPLLDKFANWLAGPKADKAINSIVDGIMKLAGWLSKVDWDGVAKKIKEWWDFLGGFKGVVEILIGLKLASWFAGAAKTAFTLVGYLTSISKSGVFGKLKDMVKVGATAAEDTGILGFLGRVGSKLVKISGLLGIVKTGYDLFQDSQITDPNQRREAYGKDIGAAAGGVIGGVAGSVVGPWGTLAGGALGAWAGKDLGGAIANWMKPENINNKEKIQRAAYLEQQLMGAGLTKNQALGIVGNIAQESSFDASARGDNGKAAGIMQWHQDRIQQILKSTGIDVTKANYADQVKAMILEMKHGDKGAQATYQAMLHNKNMSIYDAASTFNSLNERSKDAFHVEGMLRTAKAMSYQHAIDVTFKDAPPGMSVATKTDSSSGLKINTPTINTARTPTMPNGLV